MIHTVAVPPDAQMEPLLRGYRDSIAARRRVVLAGVALALVAAAISGWGAEIDPTTLWDQIGNFTSYFDRLLTLDTGARVWTDPVYWYWGLGKWALEIGQTLLIAYVGTITGAVLATFFCFFASSNMMRIGWVRFCAKRTMEFCRTVPDIVFALIFVVAFGLGPLPGVLALAVHTTGALGKLYAEVVENIDMKPVEGISASGGNWFAQVRFGALPQVMANFASYGLLRFEVNLRGATVLGFVGAGGIGEELIVAIRKFFYSDVSAILLMLVVCVVLIDIGSEKLRHRFFAPSTH